MKSDLNPNPRDSDEFAKSRISLLVDLISPHLLPLGYEAVCLEIHTHRQTTLRLFIDFAEGSKPIGIEDCAAVSRALDGPLDAMPEIEALFHGGYELEVSSPGVDRPLYRAKDYERFAGREARIRTFRPLTLDELGNASYFERNPRQKNFFGTLLGLGSDRVRLAVSEGLSAKKGKSKRKPETSKEGETGSRAEISIPLPLISRANLEPRFELGRED